MIFPFYDIPNDNGSATMIEKEKTEWVTPAVSTSFEKHYLYVTQAELAQNAPVTALVIDNTPKDRELSLDLNNSYFSDYYDLEANLPIKKAFKIKAKIKTISKYKPKIHIEEI